MSGRRSSSRSATKLTDDEINNLVSKLQEMIPELHRRNPATPSLPKILKEACNYIKSLNREVENLSERLSEILASLSTSSSMEAAVLRDLIMQQ